MQSVEKQYFTLFELLESIQETINDNLPFYYWVVAEISEIRTSSGGHCYLELIEKNEDRVIAKSRANIWASNFFSIKALFENETGKSLTKGLKIMVNVGVEYHTLYGLSLNIVAIDPVYTMGELARKRQETIQKLEEAGVIGMNKELEIPLPIKKIAVISSEQAAGYQDFCNQLQNNKSAYTFDIDLFQSTMQGEQAPSSIIAALEKVFDTHKSYDLVIIIRGGGSQIDLSCFDDYDLAMHIAQFPMPIVTGIGHERDFSVADMVAHTHLKTPTAVAEFIIDFNAELEDYLIGLQQRLYEIVNNTMHNEVAILQQFKNKLSELTYKYIHNQSIKSYKLKAELNKIALKKLNNFESRLNDFGYQIKYSIQKLKTEKLLQLAYYLKSLKTLSLSELDTNKMKIKEIELKIHQNNPQVQLEKGYVYISKNDKIIKDIKDLAEKDEIKTFFKNGTVLSTIKQLNYEQKKDKKL